MTDKSDELLAALDEMLVALQATQPILEVAMIEARKRKDHDFLTHLQTTYAANRHAINRAVGAS